MLHGDLSNRVSPRIVLVFESALGFCSDDRKFARHWGHGRWDKAAQFWDLNELCARRLLWLYHKRDLNIEVVTFLGPQEWADAINEELLSELPLHRVWATTAVDLGRKIAYMPDLAMVYDPDPARWLMYGGKGRFLTSVHQIGEGM